MITSAFTHCMSRFAQHCSHAACLRYPRLGGRARCIAERSSGSWPRRRSSAPSQMRSGHPGIQRRLELRSRHGARDAGPVSRPRRRRSSPTSRVDIATGHGERRGRARDDGARHAHADRRRHDSRRLAALLRAVRRRRHQGQLRRLSALRLRVRDRGRGRPPADGHRRAGVADLRLRAVSEPARRGATTRRTCPRACRSSRPSAPTATSTTAATIRPPTSRRISSAKRTRGRT